MSLKNLTVDGNGIGNSSATFWDVRRFTRLITTVDADPSGAHPFDTAVVRLEQSDDARTWANLSPDRQFGPGVSTIQDIEVGTYAFVRMTVVTAEGAATTLEAVGHADTKQLAGQEKAGGFGPSGSDPDTLGPFFLDLQTLGSSTPKFQVDGVTNVSWTVKVSTGAWARGEGGTLRPMTAKDPGDPFADAGTDVDEPGTVPNLSLWEENGYLIRVNSVQERLCTVEVWIHFDRSQLPIPADTTSSKGDLILDSGLSTAGEPQILEALKVGANGTILEADSTEDLGVKWSTVASVMDGTYLRRDGTVEMLGHLNMGANANKLRLGAAQNVTLEYTGSSKLKIVVDGATVIESSASVIHLYKNVQVETNRYIQMREKSAPGNPAAGYRRIFVDVATGKLSVQTSGGTTVSLEEPDTAEINDLSASVTWDDVPDANITESSVTQHEAAIDHDGLSNFVADEHVAHSSIDIIAGNGLTGGGTIDASRTLNVSPLINGGIVVAANTVGLDLNALTPGALNTADSFGYYDLSGLVTKKATLGTLQSFLDHDSLSGFVAGEHLAVGAIDHDSLLNYVAAQHATVKSGTASVTEGTPTTVTFGTTFGAAPRIALAVDDPTVYAAAIDNVVAGSFDINIDNFTGGTPTANVHWIATDAGDP